MDPNAIAQNLNSKYGAGTVFVAMAVAIVVLALLSLYLYSQKSGFAGQPRRPGGAPHGLQSRWELGGMTDADTSTLSSPVTYHQAAPFATDSELQDFQNVNRQAALSEAAMQVKLQGGSRDHVAGPNLMHFDSAEMNASI